MTETIARAAKRVLQRRAATFLASGHYAIGGGRDGELHAARIAAKRLRYNLEFFASQLAPPAQTALGLLTLLQDRLGAIADAEALSAVLSDLAAPLSPDDPRRAGIAARIAVNRAERARAIADVRALWSGAGHSPYPDMLAASLAAALESSSSRA